MDNVSPLPDKLSRLARSIKKALDRRFSGRAEWIEGTIDAAVDLAMARAEFGDDNNKFGRWCRDNRFGEDTLNKTDRASLIAMGAEPDLLRKTLESTNRWSLRRIHEEGGFHHVVKTPSDKPAKPSPPRRSTRQAKAASTAEAQLASGKRATRVTVAQEAGVSNSTARAGLNAALAREQARDELLSEFQVDPETFSTTAKQKLEVVERMLERKAQVELAARMKQIDEEVSQRVAKEGKEYHDRLMHSMGEHFAAEERFRALINDYNATFTMTEFMTILKCLHPDNSASQETRADAFRLFNAKKLQLTKETN